MWGRRHAVPFIEDGAATGIHRGAGQSSARAVSSCRMRGRGPDAASGVSGGCAVPGSRRRYICCLCSLTVRSSSCRVGCEATHLARVKEEIKTSFRAVQKLPFLGCSVRIRDSD